MRYREIRLRDSFPELGKDGRDPVLFCYLQKNMTEMGWQDRRRPCVLILPGGAYRFCSEREMEPIALNFLPAGYQVFVLDYSVAPHHYPVQLQEVAGAMELIHANAVTWNCDVSRITVIGFSAGGHLACHYSNCFDCPEVRSIFPESKAVNAAILSYPVITADPAYTHEESLRNVSGTAPLTVKEIEKFSLENLVTEKTPPTFLWHTAEDSVVPVMNSILYASALAKNNIPFAMRVYPFGRHGLSTVNGQTNESLPPEVQWAGQWMDEAKTWLDHVWKQP